MSTLSRRHYQVIADCIRQRFSADVRDGVARVFAKYMSETQANFNKERFLKACAVEEKNPDTTR